MREMRTYIKFCYGCHIENRIYFVNLTFNGIFYLELKDFSIHYLCRFVNESANVTGVSIGINTLYNNVIYFFPHNTNVIVQFDRITQIMQEIAIPEFEGKYFQTAGVIEWNDHIYIFPIELGKGIYVFDPQRLEVRKDKELSLLFAESQYFCVNTFLTHNNSVLISLDGNNQVVEISLETKKIIQHRMLPEGIQIYSMCFDGEHYWILPKNTVDIYEWDLENDILKIYRNENAEWDDSEGASSFPYSNLIFLSDEILVLNSGMREILRINKKRKTIEEPIPFPMGFRCVNSRFRGWPICDHYTILCDKVLLHPSRGNMLLIYDIRSKQLFGKEMLVDREDTPYLCDILTESFRDNRSIIERDELETLRNFVDMITTDQLRMQSYDSRGMGSQIYHIVGEEV